MQQAIQIFEHETLHVGDYHDGVRFESRHFEALKALLLRSERAYFSTGRAAVRFSSYVGILQAGDLTIEILPKMDRGAGGRGVQWQGVLIDLLRFCRLLPLHPLPAAGQKLRRHSLLDWYIELFLAEVEALIRRGLLRTYRRERSSLHVLRGRLIAGKQFQHNAARIDRFYTDHETYDYHHVFNGILWRAMKLLSSFSLSPFLEDRLHRLMIHFPDGISPPAQLPDWDQLHFNRKMERYRFAIQMAWMMIRDAHPGLRAGRYAVAGLLFDMNFLFEEFVFRQLQRFSGKDVVVRRQVRRPFWNRRHIRPDILLTTGKRNIVLDTKWKQLSKADPPMEDLQQLYIYQHYFRAEDGVLLYPQPGRLKDQPAHPFHPGDPEKDTFRCRVLFLDVLDENGRPRFDLGRDLLERVLGK